MDTITAIYQSVPPYVWGLFLGTPFIVKFIQVMKKLCGVHSTLVIHIMTVCTSFIVTAVPLYVLNDPKPWQFLGSFTGAFFLCANLLYAIAKALVPFWAAVKLYQDKKAAQHDATIDPTLQPQASVSSVTGPSVTHIAVQSGEYDG